MASLIKQDIDVKSHEEIAFNVHLTDNISYFFCFLVAETERYVVIVETTLQGTEELRILKKDKIISVDIIYDVEQILTAEPQEHHDVMFI